MSDYFLEEIILQILHKLPIKSLVRFTCVSKTWLSLIKNPSFIRDHLKLSISCSKKNPFKLLLRYCSDQNPYTIKVTEHYSLYFDDEEEEEEEYNHYMHLYFPFKLPNDNPHPCFWVVGTINGLVCLHSDTQTIIIWNPSIKKSITLPKPSVAYYECVSLGFGFDSHSNDYKVLRLANRFFGVPVAAEEQDTLEAQIYSLNMNSWKTIYVPRAGYEVKCQYSMVFVRGLIHVLAFSSVGYRNLILVFDMGDEVFTEIELPQSLAHIYSLSTLLVYKESVAVFHQDWPGPPGLGGPGPGAYVWVMEDYGAVESWTNMVSFNREEGNWPNVFGYGFNEEDGNWPYVFGFSKNGELFLQRTDEDSLEIFSFDPNIPMIKPLGVSGRYGFIDYFVESLELFDNANAQSDPSVENDGIGDAADDAVGDAADDASLLGRVLWVLFASLGVLALWSVWKRRV